MADLLTEIHQHSIKPLPISTWKLWLGKVIWSAIIARPTLASLHTAFRYPQLPGQEQVSSFATLITFQLSPAQRRELQTIISIINACQININSPVFTTIIVFDASRKVGAVVFTLATQPAAHLLWCITQRRITANTPTPKYDQQLESFVELHHWTTAFQHDFH